MIETIADIQRLARNRYTDWAALGDVRVIEQGDLLLFNYTDRAQWAGRWNVFEQVSRGLIINRVTGEIVARPFDKFWNWGERGRVSDAPIVSVAEKVDGSMIAAYLDDNEILRCATRGSFNSEQAQWAEKWLHERYKSDPPWPERLTYIFEAVYPSNRIVVDYGQRSELVLLAIRSNITGHYARPAEVDKFAAKRELSRPRNYINDLSPADLLARCATLPANDEGYVATFADGQIFKFKGQAYCELHKLISGISFKSALEAVQSGDVDTFRSRVPDEFLGEWNAWIDEIEARVASIKDLTETVYEQAPKDNRKEYAAFVNRVAPQVASYAFLRLDGKPLEPVIYKNAFKDRVSQC